MFPVLAQSLSYSSVRRNAEPAKDQRLYSTATNGITWWYDASISGASII